MMIDRPSRAIHPRLEKSINALFKSYEGTKVKKVNYFTLNYIANFNFTCEYIPWFFHSLF